MLLDEDGWLIAEEGGARVVRLPTVRTCALEVATPAGLVWHATGGVCGPRFAESLARRIQRYQRGTDRPASWHVCIGKDGTVFQSAPVTRGAWHVGRPGVVGGRHFASVNRATIGVELENAGPLVARGGRYFAWPYFVDGDHRRPDPRLRIDEKRVDERRCLPFDGFPPAQIAAATELAGSLAAYFRWGRTALSYAHAHFAAPRKTDPGPLWMEELLPGILGELGLRGAAAGGVA